MPAVIGLTPAKKDTPDSLLRSSGGLTIMARSYLGDLLVPISIATVSSKSAPTRSPHYSNYRSHVDLYVVSLIGIGVVIVTSMAKVLIVAVLHRYNRYVQSR